jgi:hypothetical protein
MLEPSPGARLGRGLPLRLLMVVFVAVIAGGAEPEIVVSAAGDRVVMGGDGPFVLRRSGGGAPLFGRWEREADRQIFVPVLPLPAGESFVVEWTGAAGEVFRREFRTAVAAATAPEVELRPAGVPLPANALKIYLHFSEPMEQGVFLERLRLYEGDGREIVGPFRETELWSPDGRRLTVWFHPGRQKTGVNLNLDEGPVLRAGARCRLVVAGSWRSVAGVALGRDRVFEWEVGPVDHHLPELATFRLEAPAAGGREPLVVDTLEPLDPGVLAGALRVHRLGQAVAGRVEVGADGRRWSLVPAAAWLAGDYELQADPDLEDLAGNSLVKPFEVDLAGPGARPVPTLVRRFTIR